MVQIYSGDLKQNSLASPSLPKLNLRFPLPALSCISQAVAHSFIFIPCDFSRKLQMCYFEDVETLSFDLPLHLHPSQNSISNGSHVSQTLPWMPFSVVLDPTRRYRGIGDNLKLRFTSCHLIYTRQCFKPYNILIGIARMFDLANCLLELLTDQTTETKYDKILY